MVLAVTIFIMLKKALLKCDCIIIQLALKTRSTIAKESRNTQGTLVNNVEKKQSKKILMNNQKFFSKLKNAEGTLITKMVETWVAGKFHPGIFHHSYIRRQYILPRKFFRFRGLGLELGLGVTVRVRVRIRG